MFNTYHNHHTEHVPYTKNVEVTEKRAPTDESIRILNEMQDKARLNIVHQIKVDSNQFKGIGIWFKTGLLTSTVDDFSKIKYFLKFNLNGKDHTIEGDCDRDEMNNIKEGFAVTQSGYRYHIPHFFFKKFSEAIAIELLKECGKSIEPFMK